MKPHLTASRREFIKRSSTAVAAFTIVPRHVLGGPGFVPPSKKVNIALIGAGGRGLGNARALMELPDVQINALADPAESYSRNQSVCGRKPARAEIEKHYGARLTEIGLLGLLAVRAGRPFEWDARNMQAKGMPELEPVIRGSYRKGWELL
jgi:hypothetical protein